MALRPRFSLARYNSPMKRDPGRRQLRFLIVIAVVLWFIAVLGGVGLWLLFASVKTP